MLFRVWDKKNNCYSKEPFLLDEDGDLWDGAGYCIVIDYKNYEVEFNTGITLADGTELFFGDIVRWKDREITPFGYGSNYRYAYSVITEEYIRENMIRFVEYQKEKKSEKPIFTITFDDDRDDLELVGNIHETELTDAMKIWIKERRL